MFAGIRSFLTRIVASDNNILSRSIYRSSLNRVETNRIQTVSIPKVWRINPPKILNFSLVSPSAIELPTNYNYPIPSGTPSPINLPTLIDKLDPLPLYEIDEPKGNSSNDIQAARLIVIRKRKMKKHKLKKLRKRMKFEWAKVRQRRELKKEKAFQAVLIAQIKEAEKFSAEDYVKEKLNKINELKAPKVEIKREKIWLRRIISP